SQDGQQAGGDAKPGAGKPAAVAEPAGLDDDAPDDAPAPAPAAVAAKPAAPAAGKGGGLVGLLLGVGIVTVLAAGLGTILGMHTAASVEEAVAERARAAAATPSAEPARSTTMDGDMVVQQVDAVVTNLAAPSNVWIRLETAVVFRKEAVENPLVLAAEIREDILAYARTMTLAQLEGPSALQHLRDDLVERAAVRTDGRVSDLVIQSLVVQ
ncbi:flagellar basal body-associated FliL family protein, partial [Enterovirga sp.]|uniref:flagellar basal body-associated FliL family protein n=1 Tax=Enterovirga sp. TaxID=2026350 RepID=UPI002B91DBF7